MSLVLDPLVANEHGQIPYLQLLTAVHGLKALEHGMQITRMATPKRCMEIISSLTGVNYKRTHRNKALRDGEILLERARAEIERNKQNASS